MQTNGINQTIMDSKTLTNPAAQIDMGKVQRSLVLAALVALSKEPINGTAAPSIYAEDGKTAADTPVLVQRLAIYFEKTADNPDSLLRCDICRGDSPERYDACPFCGKVDGATVQTLTDQTGGDNAAMEATPATAVAQATAREEEATMQTEKATSEKKGAKKDAKGSKKGADKQVTKGAETAPSGQSLTKVTPMPKNPTIVQGTAATLATEADLDKAVAKVRELKSAVATGYWDLGNFIREEIYAKNLHKLRTDNGKPKYSSFDQFVREELGFTAPVAYDLMDVSKKYSREQVLKFGHAKLALALKAPEEAQQVIEEKIEKGASHREIAADVKVAKAASGNKRRVTGRKKTPAGEKTTAKPPRAKAKPAEAEGRKTISIASIEGRKVVALFKKDDKEKHAKRLADQPFGSLEMANDVTMYFAIQERANGLVLVVDTRRNK